MANDNLKSWVEDFTDDLYKWALHKTLSSEIAEDLVQETFLVAVEKMKTFEGKSSPKTWLFSILNHKIIDFYRKKANQIVRSSNSPESTLFDADGHWQQSHRPIDWEEEEEHLLDNDEFQAILKRCLDALPEKWSSCVKLKYLSEKKGEDICQELDMTLTNYWQIVHRAKLQLRDCIENKWFKN